MARSNVFVSVPSRNPSHENIVPLESVVTGEPSIFDRRVASGSVDPEHPHERARKELESQRVVLGKLKAWHQWDTDRYKSLGKFLMSKAGFPRRPIHPTRDQLSSLATYFFPPRNLLKVVVCDFGYYKKFERIEVDLKEIQPYWEDKPPWVMVRWIHVPIGSGSVQHKLKDLFSQAKVEKGPYSGFEILSLRGRKYLQDQSDVFNILRKSHHPGDECNELTFNNDTDISHLPVTSNFWSEVQSDLPWQLDEGIRSDFAKIELARRSLAPRIGPQLLSRHPSYREKVLVRDYFRWFLLTASPIASFYCTNADLQLDIGSTLPSRVMSKKNEILRRDWELYKTDLWAMKPGVHLLMILLIIELEIAPHDDQVVPDIQDAYLPIVRDLKRRRASRFRRHESVDLVREYVSCMDEISQIHEISTQKVELLEKLREHCKVLQRASCNDQIFGQLDKDSLLVEQIDGAIKRTKGKNENFPRLVNDLKTSLDVLFQLRTIEQNELAIIAESNNKAILIFTVVTIIFLPLSFFTSYFGMNLQDISNTDKTQGYFWAVCGSVTLFIVSFTVVFGFKERLYGWIWANRDYARARDFQ